MGSVCAEHHHHHHHQTHKFHPLLSPKKALQDLNIPPRKLLSRRTDASDYYSPSSDGAALMQKFLPCNGDSDDAFDPDDDPYSSDEFRMYEFKVRKCTRSRSHDWTDCPFSHPGEKARRRDPRRFHYAGTVCPEYRRTGGCTRGDECEFAHGVFECWLHPARYRTEACKDGKNCKRKVCFFAHSPRELRVLPAEEDGDERENCPQTQRGNKHHCCRYCCALSPTSTLLGLSNFSPPMSPSRYSPACGSKCLSYQDMVIADILGSLEGMNLNDGLSPNKSTSVGRGLWVDVNNDDYHQHQQQQMQFSLSPSTPLNPSVFSSNLFSAANSDSSPVSGPAFNTINNNHGVEESPDLGWVNDLLM